MRRELPGLGDDGSRHRIVIWIGRRTGGRWTVGRLIDPDGPSLESASRSDDLYEGPDLDAALEAANAALEADRSISAAEGIAVTADPFVSAEVVAPLERWMFGQDAAARRRRS